MTCIILDAHTSFDIILIVHTSRSHYYADLCKVYPDVKVVHAEGQAPSGSNSWPEVK
jgi:hypothetical protein